MNHKHILTLVALSVGCLLADSLIAVSPNIVLILADDVGQEVIGCYGGTSYATPRIDDLAERGMRFRHGYVMAVCHPTRVSLLSGRYPFRLGHPKWGSYPKNEESRTLASSLKRGGYATAIAGKWQLALLKDDPRHPHRMGFDEYCLFGWHEGARYYSPLIWQNAKLREDAANRYGPELYTDFLIDFMTRNRERPFFALYSMALCHDVTDDLEKPVPFAPGKDRYDSYAEMVEAMDRMVGRLVDSVDRLGIEKRTLILFVGDNGTAQRSIARVEKGKLVRDPVVSRLGDRDIPGGKGTLTDRGTRVPWIATWPGTVPSGRVTDALVDVSDIMPTLVDIAGAQLPSGLTVDGQSFAAALRGESKGERGRDWVFAEHGGKSWVRDRRWKLYDDGRLFDLKSTPDESEPVSKPSDEAAVARRRLEAIQASLGLPKKKPKRAER